MHMPYAQSLGEDFQRLVPYLFNHKELVFFPASSINLKGSMTHLQNIVGGGGGVLKEKNGH